MVVKIFIMGALLVATRRRVPSKEISPLNLGLKYTSPGCRVAWGGDGSRSQENCHHMLMVNALIDSLIYPTCKYVPPVGVTKLTNIDMISVLSFVTYFNSFNFLYISQKYKFTSL